MSSDPRVPTALVEGASVGAIALFWVVVAALGPHLGSTPFLPVSPADTLTGAMLLLVAVGNVLLYGVLRVRMR